MIWIKKSYEIKLDDGKTGYVDGFSNGLFGVSRSYVLSHIKTGYKIAEFRDEESVRRVADYLAEKYANEFNELHNEYRKSMTYDEYKRLASAIDLNAKINADAYFKAQIAEFAVQPIKK